jgi:multiple sugar transport system substrate-binding protein
MKKFITVLCIGVLSVSFVFAGGSGQRGSGKTTLTLYTWWGSSERTMGEALTADFMAKYPNIVVEENHGGTDYLAKINTLIASGTTPDVFQVSEGLVNEWGEKGVGADLNPYYQKAGIDPLAFYVDVYRFSSNGHLWGIGANPTSILLYYNKDLLKQAGIAEPPADATKPWTWEQFVANAKKLTKDSRGRTPNDPGFNYDDVVQWGTVMPTNNYVYWMALLYSAGASVADDAGTALALDSPAGKRVLQSIQNLSTVDKAAPSYATTISNTFSNEPVMLMNGQIAMAISGGWQTGDYYNENFDVGVAQVPTFSNKPSNNTWGAGFMMKSGGSQEAFQLYEYYMNFNNWVSAAKNHRISLTGGIPTTKNTYSDPALNAAWNSVNNPVIGRVFADITQNAARVGENVTLKNFDEIMQQFIKPGLDRVWMGEETVDQALANIKGQLTGKFKGAWK